MGMNNLIRNIAGMTLILFVGWGLHNCFELNMKIKQILLNEQRKNEEESNANAAETN